ncbi:hypothetical protein PSAC2689_100086 [Paraburkholderia sacchari]
MLPQAAGSYHVHHAASGPASDFVFTQSGRQVVAPTLAVVASTAQICWALVDQRYEQSQRSAHQLLVATSFCLRGVFPTMEEVVPHTRGRVDGLRDGAGAMQGLGLPTIREGQELRRFTCEQRNRQRHVASWRYVEPCRCIVGQS